MDTRGHELSPTLEGGGGGNILCHIFWNYVSITLLICNYSAFLDLLPDVAHF